jgi:hypothetical protein
VQAGLLLFTLDLSNVRPDVIRIIGNAPSLMTRLKELTVSFLYSSDLDDAKMFSDCLPRLQALRTLALSQLAFDRDLCVWNLAQLRSLTLEHVSPLPVVRAPHLRQLKFTLDLTDVEELTQSIELCLGHPELISIDIDLPHKGYILVVNDACDRFASALRGFCWPKLSTLAFMPILDDTAQVIRALMASASFGQSLPLKSLRCAATSGLEMRDVLLAFPTLETVQFFNFAPRAGLGKCV